MKKISLFFAALALSAMTFAADFKKVTSAPADWSGEYIVVYEATADSAVIFSEEIDKANNYVTAVIASGAIKGTFNTLVIAKMEGGYSLQIKGGDNDGKYLAGLSGDNKMKFDTTATAATIAYSATYNSSEITSNTSVMRFNKASNAKWFRFFKASSYTTQQPVQLYKLKKQAEATLVDSIGLKNHGLDTVEVGGQLDLKTCYTIFPDSATDQRVEFSIISGEEFISLDNGVVTGLDEGDAQVKITSLDSLNTSLTLSATFFIHVKAAAPKPVLQPVNSISNLIACYDQGIISDQDTVRVTGFISTMFLKPTNFAKYGSATIWLCEASEDVGTAKEFQLYNCYGQDGDTLASFSPEASGSSNVDVEEIVARCGITYAQGDSVVAFGKIKKYNTTYELDGGCYFVGGGTATRINEVAEKAQTPATRKIIRNNQVIFIREGKTFNALGVQLQ